MSARPENTCSVGEEHGEASCPPPPLPRRSICTVANGCARGRPGESSPGPGRLPECEWVTGDSSGRAPGHPFLRRCRQPPPVQAERATPPSLRSREPPHNGSLSLMTPSLFTLERNSSDTLSHKGPEVHKTDQSGPGDQGHTEPGWVLGARLRPTSLGEWPSLSEPQLPCLRNGLTSPSCCPGPHSRPLSCRLSGLTVLGPAEHRFIICQMESLRHQPSPSDTVSFRSRMAGAVRVGCMERGGRVGGEGVGLRGVPTDPLRPRLLVFGTSAYSPSSSLSL